jgi:hypothetical protein
VGGIISRFIGKDPPMRGFLELSGFYAPRIAKGSKE